MTYSPYILAAVEGEVARVRTAPEFGRNNALFRAACAIGSLVQGGGLGFDLVWARLEEAARDVGLTATETRATLRSGFRHGSKHPRVPPARSTHLLSLKSLRSQVSARAHRRPPQAEVKKVWDGGRPVTTDQAVSAWLRSRKLDPERIAFWDAARVLPAGPLPTWASLASRPWSATGYRVVFPLRGHVGEIESLRVRSVHTESKLKSVSPTGFEVSGLVLADSTFAELLTGRRPAWWNNDIVIVEGEPDFLTWINGQSDAAETSYALVGVFMGAWTSHIAHCVPDQSRVVIRTHHDPAGESLASRITNTLGNRCTLLRSSA